ncbi:MAG: ATP-dependent sacrificial sulfur transferase LarE [Lachnospiraceae bacterium]|nr:ATP-dependent sacrificial sulfur transferase LarE [Lachnospiraceae bacterium]
MLEKETELKLNKLKEYIKTLGSLAVGFSGGVDSTLLITVAHEVLGDKAIAVTEVSSFVPEREIKEAKKFCEERGIILEMAETDPLKEEKVRFNDPRRCYYCKFDIFGEIQRIAKEHGIEYVAEGSNMDDLGDYRPGLEAVAELKVKSPLREAGLTKADIRAISKELGLPTWDKPSYACLASRFVYGEEITPEKLAMVDKAEQFLIDKGFREERVRVHGDLARIEVPSYDIESISKEELRNEICEELKKIGFRYVTLDLLGYRVGSMNEVLKK